MLLLAPGLAAAGDKMSREEVEQLVRRYADIYKLPHGLVLRTVKRESRFDPSARNGPYWGLMQIRYDTAKGVGYRGTAKGLLDPETNLTYGVAYLANAYMIAGGNENGAHRLYRSGYYYEAKRKRLLAKLIKAPPVAQPQVMLASVLPEPRLSLGFAREPEPAPSAAVLAKAAMDAAPDVPLPAPRPEHAAAEAVIVAAVAPAAADVSEPAFDTAAANAPLPRRRPAHGQATLEQVASLQTPQPAAVQTATLVAAIAIPVPKPRPVQ